MFCLVTHVDPAQPNFWNRFQGITKGSLFCLIVNFDTSQPWETSHRCCCVPRKLQKFKKKLVVSGNFIFASKSINDSMTFMFSFVVTPSQIERLYSRFTSLDRTDCGTLSRDDFLRIPELAINPLCDRIVHAFFADSTDDRVNFRKFMQVLAHFRPIKKSSVNKLNNREQKLLCK